MTCDTSIYFPALEERRWPSIRYGGGSEHVFVEVDPFCQRVLKKNFPNSQIHGDIRNFKGRSFRRPDILTGGFPCQPFSVAGKRQSTGDDRYLWPEMLRVIDEARPTWIVGENVTNIIELALEEVCASLESIGYEVQPIIIPAVGLDAPHQRDRIWIIAHANGERWDLVDQNEKGERATVDLPSFDGWFHHPDHLRLDVDGLFPLTSSGQERNDDGLPEGMDRLKGYGNAWVPQVAAEIFKAIKTLKA